MSFTFSTSSGLVEWKPALFSDDDDDIAVMLSLCFDGQSVVYPDQPLSRTFSEIYRCLCRTVLLRKQSLFRIYSEGASLEFASIDVDDVSITLLIGEKAAASAAASCREVAENVFEEVKKWSKTLSIYEEPETTQSRFSPSILSIREFYLARDHNALAE